MKLYTIGYSTYELSSFINVLKKYKIDVIVDVRSSPFSSFYSEYNKDNLRNVLKKNGLKYLFLGDNLGARINAPECYQNDGKAIYEKISKHPIFKEGLQRLKKGVEIYNVVLLCAEKDPINCHRNILVCRNIKSENLDIIHILSNGELENNNVTEIRLLKLHNLFEDDMFSTFEDRLNLAYTQQGYNIAYIENSDIEEGVKND
jgi:uncharacterized protein (DUF488 family)